MTIDSVARNCFNENRFAVRYPVYRSGKRSFDGKNEISPFPFAFVIRINFTSLGKCPRDRALFKVKSSDLDAVTFLSFCLRTSVVRTYFLTCHLTFRLFERDLPLSSIARVFHGEAVQKQSTIDAGQISWSWSSERSSSLDRRQMNFQGIWCVRSLNRFLDVEGLLS